MHVPSQGFSWFRWPAGMFPTGPVTGSAAQAFLPGITIRVAPCLAVPLPCRYRRSIIMRRPALSCRRGIIQRPAARRPCLAVPSCRPVITPRLVVRRPYAPGCILTLYRAIPRPEYGPGNMTVIIPIMGEGQEAIIMNGRSSPPIHRMILAATSSPTTATAPPATPVRVPSSHRLSVN